MKVYRIRVSKYDYRINKMVYKLYNLTPEGIEIVESFKNK